MIKLSSLCLLLALSASGANLPLPEKFIVAEIQVESNGRDNAIGDDGKAIGCLQVHKACHKDSGVTGDYTNCFNRAYSIKVITGYLNRYCPRAIKQNDFETMARVWNGGPGGASNSHTISYWRKVKAAMDKK